MSNTDSLRRKKSIILFKSKEGILIYSQTVHKKLLFASSLTRKVKLLWRDRCFSSTLIKL